MGCLKCKDPLASSGSYLILGFISLGLEFLGFVFSWNNGLREAVVSRSFLFLSTFFIQVLHVSYKLDFILSITIMAIFKETCV